VTAAAVGAGREGAGSVAPLMGSLIKKRRKRMRKKKHKKMLKRTRWQRRAAGK
jgi:mRNA-processing protein COX24